METSPCTVKYVYLVSLVYLTSVSGAKMVHPGNRSGARVAYHYCTVNVLQYITVLAVLYSKFTQFESSKRLSASPTLGVEFLADISFFSISISVSIFISRSVFVPVFFSVFSLLVYPILSIKSILNLLFTYYNCISCFWWVQPTESKPQTIILHPISLWRVKS